MSLRVRCCLFVACFLAVGVAEARADPITVEFQRITSNSSENVASQLSVLIYGASEANSTFSLSGGAALSGNEVLFVVMNNVGTASAISEFYIDDGPVVSQDVVHNSLAGYTDFDGGGANPGNLPGGNTVGFEATVAFSADAQGNPNKGVDASSDKLGLQFSTVYGLTGIASALADGSLRIGLHVRSIGTDGESDSFVNLSAVPEPTTLALTALGLLGGLVAARRRRRA